LSVDNTLSTAVTPLAKVTAGYQQDQAGRNRLGAERQANVSKGPLASVADLTLLSVSPRVHYGNVKSKATLES
jgi:hypothetical protein